MTTIVGIEDAEDWLAKAKAWIVDSPDQYLLAGCFNKDLLDASRGSEEPALREAIGIMAKKLEDFKGVYKK